MGVLVVIVEYRGIEQLIPEIANAATGDGPVTMLQLRDAEYSQKVCNKLTQDGWLGAHSSGEVQKAVTEDYNTRFNEACKVVRKELQAQGIATECMVRDGDLVNTVLRVTEELGQIDTVILGKPTRSWLTRWFKDFNVRLLCDRSPVPVKVIPLGND